MIILAMGLTRLKTWTFYWISQEGMLAGTLVYVNAGTQLATIERMGDIFSLRLLLSFILLGIFPWFSLAAVRGLHSRCVSRRCGRPLLLTLILIVIAST